MDNCLTSLLYCILCIRPSEDGYKELYYPKYNENFVCSQLLYNCWIIYNNKENIENNNIIYVFINIIQPIKFMWNRLKLQIIYIKFIKKLIKNTNCII